jgi:hypothetical protein
VKFDIANHASGGRKKSRETEVLWIKNREGISTGSDVPIQDVPMLIK